MTEVTVTTLLLDVDGTLYPANASITDQYRKNKEIALSRWSSPTISFPQLGGDTAGIDQHWIERLSRIGCVSLTEIVRQLYDIDLSEIHPNPALGDVLRLAMRDSSLVAFSNASHAHAQRVLRRLEVLDAFDLISGLDDRGFREKPRAEAYAFLAAQMGQKFETYALVDDGIANLREAARLGMQAVHLCNEKPCRESADSVRHSYDMREAIQLARR